MDNDKTYVCNTCNDRHYMWSDNFNRDVVCWDCPIPCDNCKGKNPFCKTTPCRCACHTNDTGATVITRENMLLNFIANYAPSFDYKMCGRLVWLSFLKANETYKCDDCYQEAYFKVHDPTNTVSQLWYWCGICELGGGGRI